MIKIFSENLFNHTVCLLLVSVFLSTFPTGATALAFCLDERENHVVGQNFYLANCHVAIETPLTLSEEHCSVLNKGKNNDCTDVSLTIANKLNRPSKIILPTSSKVILFNTLPNELVSFQQRVLGYYSSTLSQPLFIWPQIDPHRTVVLLI